MGRQFSPVYGNPAQDPLAELKAQVANVHRYLIEQGHDATNAAQAAQGSVNTGTANAVAGITGGGGGLSDKLKESQIVWDPVTGHNHASGNSAPVTLAGDLSGTNQAAVVAQAAGNFLVVGNLQVTGAAGGSLVTTDAATATPLTVLTLGHLSSGAAAAGLGTEIDFESQDSAGVAFTTNFMRSLYAGGTVGGGTANSTFVWGGMMNNTAVEMMRLRTTVGMAPSGGVGGQVWCRADFLHSGNSLSYFNGAQTTQRAGASAAGIAAITDANARAAITALQAAIGAAGYNLVTSPA